MRVRARIPMHVLTWIETDGITSLEDKDVSDGHTDEMDEKDAPSGSQTNRRAYGWTDGRTDGRTTDGRMGERTDERTDGRKTDGRTDARTDRRTED